jgi:hypothetical protein
MFRPLRCPTGDLKHDAVRVRSAVTHELLVFLLTSLNWVHWKDLETGHDRLLITSLFLLCLLLSGRALWQWRCRQYVPPKGWWTTRLCGVTYNNNILLYPQDHSRIHKRPPVVLIPRHMKAVHVLTLLHKTHLTIFSHTCMQIIVVASYLGGFPIGNLYAFLLLLHFFCRGM